MEFGILISQARAARRPKLSQAALAEALGVHQTTISDLEMGDKVPSLEQVQALAEELGLDEDALLDAAGYLRGEMVVDGQRWHVLSHPESGAVIRHRLAPPNDFGAGDAPPPERPEDLEAEELVALNPKQREMLRRTDGMSPEDFDRLLEVLRITRDDE